MRTGSRREIRRDPINTRPGVSAPGFIFINSPLTPIPVIWYNGRDMRKRKKSNGFDQLIFEKGDGALKRWTEALQPWRLISPENRPLPHAYSWYLEEEHVGRRPTLGLISLAHFAEKLLYRAYTYCPGTRASAKAQRLFMTIRRKMAQMKYRGDRHGRIQTKEEKRYMKTTVCGILPLARAALDAVQAEGLKPRTVTLREALE